MYICVCMYSLGATRFELICSVASRRLPAHRPPVFDYLTSYCDI